MNKITGIRKLKKEVSGILLENTLETALHKLSEYPVKQIVNPLIALLCSGNNQLKWRAVTALGRFVPTLFDKSREDGRVIMRRFLWMLNEESGGIGWGVPEVIGEVLHNHRKLAEEYSRILISYLNEGGNYLEHPPLHQGILWGIERLASAWPDLSGWASDITTEFLDSDNPKCIGLAIKIAAHLNNGRVIPVLKEKQSDQRAISLFEETDFKSYTISSLATEALQHLNTA